MSNFKEFCNLTFVISILYQGKQVLAPAGWAWQWQNTSGGLLPEQIERGAYCMTCSSRCIALDHYPFSRKAMCCCTLHDYFMRLFGCDPFKVCFVEQRLAIIVPLRRIRISSLCELVECLGKAFFSLFPVHVSFVKPRISTIPTSNAWDIWGNKLRRNSWPIRRMDPLRARWNGFVAFSRRLRDESS